jgi:hypothetical protein
VNLSNFGQKLGFSCLRKGHGWTSWREDGGSTPLPQSCLV